MPISPVLQRMVWGSLRRINPAYCPIVLGELRKHPPSAEREGTGGSWFVGKETDLRLWSVGTPPLPLG